MKTALTSLIALALALAAGCTTTEPAAAPTNTTAPTTVATAMATPVPTVTATECYVGLKLQPGDKCTAGTFSITIQDDGSALLDGNIGGIVMGNTVMSAKTINLNRFQASRSETTWTINNLP